MRAAFGVLDGERRFQPVFEQPVADTELEREGVTGARLRSVAQQQDDVRAVGAVHFERQVSREAVLGQGMDLAAGIAPAARLAVDEVPADERKQHRIAAADLRGVRPVGGVRPVQDVFTVMAPAHQPAAGFGCEQQHGTAGTVVADADEEMFLEAGSRKVEHGSRGGALLVWESRTTV